MKDYPLVLIHGYPFDHTMWFSTIASLGASARVIAPDLPGFGKNSLLPEGSPSLDLMADFIARVLEENNAPKAVIAGMSMGGYVALAFAERHADKVAGLALVSSQAAADNADTRKARKESIEKIRAHGTSAALQTLLPKIFAQPEPKNPELKSYPEKAAQQAGVEGLCWALEAMAKRPDRTALLKAMLQPVLVAHGTLDRIIPFSRARELAESCVNPIFVEVPGAGHATPLEGPDEVALGLARLMKKCRQEQMLSEPAAS